MLFRSSLGYAEAMLQLYNRKMKSGLSWTKLYSNKNEIPNDINLVEEPEEAEQEEMEL